MLIGRLHEATPVVRSVFDFVGKCLVLGASDAESSNAKRAGAGAGAGAVAKAAGARAAGGKGGEPEAAWGVWASGEYGAAGRCDVRHAARGLVSKLVSG